MPQPKKMKMLFLTGLLQKYARTQEFQLFWDSFLQSNPCGFLVGGNFCAGYDLKELAHCSTLLKLEQDVTSGLAPVVGT